MKKILFLLFVLSTLSCEDDHSTPSQGTSSGSYANMLIIGGYLYAVSDSDIATYDLTDPIHPLEIKREKLDFGIESLLHHSGLLFVGSRSAMYIFEIGADGIPILQSTSDYNLQSWAIECSHDPIVVNDSIAIASLSSRLISRFMCGPSPINELRFFNIKELTSPRLINSYQMDEPKGMALDGQYLFVCLKNDGLRILDISDPLNPIPKYSYPDIKTYDIILKDDVFFVVSSESIYVFEYLDISQISLISTILI